MIGCEVANWLQPAQRTSPLTVLESGRCFVSGANGDGSIGQSSRLYFVPAVAAKARGTVVASWGLWYNDGRFHREPVWSMGASNACRTK